MALALLVVVAAACGGDDESSTTTTTESSTTTTESSTPTEESSTTEATLDDASAQARFTDAQTASEVDTSADEPDPSTFTDTFAANDSGIFVVYRLDDDAEVNITWMYGGEEALQDSLQVPGDLWAFHQITPEPGGFEPGEWEVVLEIVGGDAREVLTFTVTP